ncbi:ASCH domain-containing protein [Aquidulcibacter sp.]|uniref:ASCH domain-containing protein n=1 Tax=Aquidulcibacter sp. TaxID=2052990 RepID=UPI0037841378
MSKSSEWWRSLPTTSFGSSHMEERLAGLIIAGRKRATVWNGLEDNPTKPGMNWVVTANARPVAVIETLSVGQCRFEEIDANFAFEEGEGDRSLAHWRVVHQAFFEKEGSFSPNMILWWEKFRLVEALDADLAAKSEEMVVLDEADAAELLANQP